MPTRFDAFTAVALALARVAANIRLWPPSDTACIPSRAGIPSAPIPTSNRRPSFIMTLPASSQTPSASGTGLHVLRTSVQPSHSAISSSLLMVALRPTICILAGISSGLSFDGGRLFCRCCFCCVSIISSVGPRDSSPMRCISSIIIRPISCVHSRPRRMAASMASFVATTMSASSIFTGPRAAAAAPRSPVRRAAVIAASVRASPSRRRRARSLPRHPAPDTFTSERASNSAYFSAASARSGLRYTTRPPPRARCDKMASVATSVLPLAVGAETSRLRPSSSPAPTAAACGGYSSANPRDLRNLLAPAGIVPSPDMRASPPGARPPFFSFFSFVMPCCKSRDDAHK